MSFLLRTEQNEAVNETKPLLRTPPPPGTPDKTSPCRETFLMRQDRKVNTISYSEQKRRMSRKTVELWLLPSFPMDQ